MASKKRIFRRRGHRLTKNVCGAGFGLLILAVLAASTLDGFNCVADSHAETPPPFPPPTQKAATRRRSGTTAVVSLRSASLEQASTPGENAQPNHNDLGLVVGPSAKGIHGVWVLNSAGTRGREVQGRVEDGDEIVEVEGIPTWQLGERGVRALLLGGGGGAGGGEGGGGHVELRVRREGATLPVVLKRNPEGVPTVSRRDNVLLLAEHAKRVSDVADALTVAYPHVYATDDAIRAALIRVEKGAHKVNRSKVNKSNENSTAASRSLNSSSHLDTAPSVSKTDGAEEEEEEEGEEVEARAVRELADAVTESERQAYLLETLDVLLMVGS